LPTAFSMLKVNTENDSRAIARQLLLMIDKPNLCKETGASLISVSETLGWPDLMIILKAENVESIKEALLYLRKQFNFESSTIIGMEVKEFSNYKQESRRLFEKVLTAVTNKEKKDSLEQFTRFLLDSIPEFHVTFVNARTKAEEIDLIVANESPPELVSSRLSKLGTPILVECKNWCKPIGAPEIRDFYGKLVAQSVKTGILISMNGISKDAFLLLREFKKDHLIIVLDGDDLQDISSHSDLTKKINEKYYSLFKI
jgi:hypothetical protein